MIVQNITFDELPYTVEEIQNNHTNDNFEWKNLYKNLHNLSSVLKTNNIRLNVDDFAKNIFVPLAALSDMLVEHATEIFHYDCQRIYTHQNACDGTIMGHVKLLRSSHINDILRNLTIKLKSKDSSNQHNGVQIYIPDYVTNKVHMLYNYQKIYNILERSTPDGARRAVKWIPYNIVILDKIFIKQYKYLIYNPTIPTSLAITFLKRYRAGKSNKKFWLDILSNPALPSYSLTTEEKNLKEYRTVRGEFWQKDYMLTEEYVIYCMRRELTMKSNICACLARIARLVGGRRFIIIRCLYCEIFTSISRSGWQIAYTHYSDRATLKQ
jgi:hypothetical protein